MAAVKFPEFWKRAYWKVVKSGEDLWLTLSTKDKRRIGSKTIYEREKNPKEKVLEINIFNQGAVAHSWFPDAVNSPKRIFARLLKDDAWLYGLAGEPISMWGLLEEDTDALIGVRLSLRVAPQEIAVVDIYKQHQGQRR